MALRTDDFDYPLDDSLIAQEPSPRRDASRLMVLRRATGQVEHRVFSDLPQLLRPGDVLVVNDTRVIPAKFLCRRSSGGKIEGLFLHQPRADRWEVLLKNAARCRAGETLALEGGDGAAVTLVENQGQGRWLVAADPASPAAEILERVGSPPLPPYIRREHPPQQAQDRQRYQTVYASQSGAVAAPTAGLHFTPALLEQLAAAGVQTARVTLHVGMGTFLPVKADQIEQHTMHREWYDLPAETSARLRQARREGRRIVAVGTTSVRVLETVARATPPGGEFLPPGKGWTDIFIYPPAEFRAVDALITNFHLPRSTLLMLVSAFCRPGTADGVAMIRAAYAQATHQRYRFFSYGDAMLIE